jgi:hypothetical protein
MFYTLGPKAAIALAASMVFAGTSHALGVPGQGTWETTLQPRDINGDGVVDAYYDAVLNVSWLADGQAARGTAYETTEYPPGSGAATFANALAWTTALDVYGVSGWRLPRLIDTGAPGCQWAYVGTDCGYNVQTISSDGQTVYSELAHLYYLTLGNLGRYDAQGFGRANAGSYGLVNTGSFVNFVSQPYWHVVANPPPNADSAWVFVNEWGLQPDWDLSEWRQFNSPEPIAFAIAVLDGDVSAVIAQVPEPATYGLMGVGLLAIWGATFRRATRAAAPSIDALHVGAHANG